MSSSSPPNTGQPAYSTDNVNTTQISNINQTFPKFKDLPTELRNMIWNHALDIEPGRIIHLAMHAGDVAYVSKRRQRVAEARAAKASRAVMYACKESRIEGLKRYRWTVFRDKRRRVIRVDPAKDLLLLDDPPVVFKFQLHRSDKALLLKLKHDLEDQGLSCQDIRHLGVKSSWFEHFLSDMEKEGESAASIFEFRNLESLTLFYCAHTQDLFDRRSRLPHLWTLDFTAKRGPWGSDIYLDHRKEEIDYKLGCVERVLSELGEDKVGWKKPDLRLLAIGWCEEAQNGRVFMYQKPTTPLSHYFFPHTSQD